MIALPVLSLSVLNSLTDFCKWFLLGAVRGLALLKTVFQTKP